MATDGEVYIDPMRDGFMCLDCQKWYKSENKARKCFKSHHTFFGFRKRVK